MRITVMGAGSISGGIADELGRHRRQGTLPASSSIRVADLDAARARQVAERISVGTGTADTDQTGAVDTGTGTVDAVTVDITDPDSLSALLQETDLVVNAVGPFSRFGRTVIDACIRAGVHYVDVCDEDTVAADVLLDPALDEAAQSQGSTIVFGCGASPGITNLAARAGIEALDQAEAVDLFVAVPTMPSFGVTINHHMLDALSGTVLQHHDGRLTAMPAWADPRQVELADGFGSHEFGYMGHPEPIALSRAYPHLDRATIRWSWMEPATNALWQDFARLGLTDATTVPGADISPRALIAHLLDSPAAERIPGAMPTARPVGSAWRLVVQGHKDGAPAQAVVDNVIRYSELRCRPETLTAWLAAEAAVHIATGAITRRGVVTPEQVLDPQPVLRDYAQATGCTIDLSIRETAMAPA